jgi:hypothetical protein
MKLSSNKNYSLSCITIAAIFCNLAVFASIAFSQNQPEVSFVSLKEADPTADIIKVSTPNHSNEISGFNPKLGVFTYQAAWEGIPAAEAKIELEADGLHYFVNISVKTYSAIDVFYRLRYDARGVIGAQSFMPLKSVYDHKENSKTRLTEISYLESGEVRSYRKRDSKEPEVMQFNPNNFMYDPFSMAFIARGLKWELGSKKYFDVFNGKSRYLITLEAIEKTTLSVNGSDRDVWVISPQVDNLTSRKNNKKLRSAKIYVSADADREILKISSSVFVGEVSAKLISFEPPKAPGETTLASNRLEYFLN